jgi:pectinesterase
MARSSAAAASFCLTYTTATTSATLAAWATVCSGSPVRISSGCSCINTARPTTVPVSSTTSSTIVAAASSTSSSSPTNTICPRISPQPGAIVVDNSASPAPNSYPTMQQGVNALSLTSIHPQSLFIYPGSYYEQVYIPPL